MLASPISDVQALQLLLKRHHAQKGMLLPYEWYVKHEHPPLTTRFQISAKTAYHKEAHFPFIIRQVNITRILPTSSPEYGFFVLTGTLHSRLPNNTLPTVHKSLPASSRIIIGERIQLTCYPPGPSGPKGQIDR